MANSRQAASSAQTNISDFTAEPRGSLVLFFALTYAVTWVCWIAVLNLHFAGRGLNRNFLLLLGTFAPALVALVITARQRGKRATRSLLQRTWQWQGRARWYALAVLYMAAIKLCVAVVYRLEFGGWPHFGEWRPVIILAATVISTPFQAGEEIGWRGYALPRLAGRMGFAWASVVLGIIWACWHLPLFFLAGADKFGQSFPLWAFEVVAFSVAITWLYVHTDGSLLLTMLMHSALNQSLGIVPSAVPGANNPFSLHASPVMWLTTILLWLPATYFLLRMPRVETVASGESQIDPRASSPAH